MVWEFEYLQEAYLVRVTEEGLFSAESHNKMTKELISQDFWEPGMNIMFDSTNLDLSKTRYEDMRGAAQMFISHDELLGRGRIALYMKSSSNFARGRQFEMLVEAKIGAKISVFLNEEQALCWLHEKEVEAV